MILLHLFNNHSKIAIYWRRSTKLTSFSLKKKEVSESLANYRPIFLCNVTYKLITKIIARRIRILLDRLISHYQGAFVLRHLIIDNIIIAQEIFHSMKSMRGRNDAFALKLDIIKAYERLKWDFISVVLRSFGFQNKTHDLIMSGIKGARFSILINGNPEGNISPSRGIR